MNGKLWGAAYKQTPLPCSRRYAFRKRLGNFVRIAVISDIHGNLRALEAVQSDLRQRSPDLVVNLGDHLSGPLDAAGTADVLMAEKYLSILGNHDRELLNRPVEEMGASDRAARVRIHDRHKLWLQDLPARLELEPDILLCHGTPEDDLEYLLETQSAVACRS